LLIHVLRACISPLVKKHIYNVFDNLLEATLVLLLTEKKRCRKLTHHAIVSDIGSTIFYYDTFR